MSHTKRVARIVASPPRHWVGDGFHVASVISPQGVGDSLSPFVLMDYGGPDHFAPADAPRGVDTHPHRGFETVTIVYQGEFEHRDSAGNHGTIGAGDVQWMTAARGVLHEEKHSAAFTRTGGTIEVAQLWVNLPARHKMAAPRYQTLLGSRIPTVSLPGDAGRVRVIAGPFGGAAAAAQTLSPVIVWDCALHGGGRATLPVPDGFSACVFVRGGHVAIGGDGGDERPVRARELAVLDRAGAGIELRATEAAEFLVLGGQPLDEPVVAYGPFVMNSQQEIQQAVADFRAGKFGEL